MSNYKFRFVPESFKRKQERDTKDASDLTKQRADRKSLISKRRQEWRDKAKKYHDAYLTQQKNLVNEKRVARNAGNFYVPPEAKVVFVIRLKGINKIRPQVKKILQLFRLRQLNNGVFIKINKATLNMLRRVEPYVTYGYPNRDTVSQLIYKRGFLKLNRSRIPITDNLLIEQNLGKVGISCVEDLIEEVYQVGPHYKEANNLLWPFKLSNPRGGWRNKNHAFQKDGDWGNREENINQLIRSMN
jgi:large subunit ribosomal protein L7e